MGGALQGSRHVRLKMPARNFAREAIAPVRRSMANAAISSKNHRGRLYFSLPGGDGGN